MSDEEISSYIASRRAQGVNLTIPKGQVAATRANDPAERVRRASAFTQGPAPYPGQATPAVESAKATAGLAVQPATWLMRQVGARVDAGEASAVRAFTGQGPFLKGLFVDMPRGYVTGEPPAGLPREQA